MATNSGIETIWPSGQVTLTVTIAKSVTGRSVVDGRSGADGDGSLPGVNVFAGHVQRSAFQQGHRIAVVGICVVIIDAGERAAHAAGSEGVRWIVRLGDDLIHKLPAQRYGGGGGANGLALLIGSGDGPDDAERENGEHDRGDQALEEREARAARRAISSLNRDVPDPSFPVTLAMISWVWGFKIQPVFPSGRGMGWLLPIISTEFDPFSGLTGSSLRYGPYWKAGND